MRRLLWAVSVAGALLAGLSLVRGRAASAAPAWQVASPTPPPLRVEIYQDVHVRAGPGTYYDQVGEMIRGQSGAILGQAKVGVYTWLKIVYIGGPDNTGWVLKDLVRVVGDIQSAPTVIPPPTPTLPPTPQPGSPDVLENV